MQYCPALHRRNIRTWGSYKLTNLVESKELAPVDPENAIVSYPSYKNLDPYLDIHRLRSLNSYLTQRIRRRINEQKDSLFLNLHRLDQDSPYEPGVREIWLSRTKPGTPYDYLDLDKPHLWELTADAREFTLLLDFIRTLPIKETGRMLIIYDEGGRPVPAHRDHESREICHEFVWFRTNLNKPFYLLNENSGEKLYVNSYSAWFDTVNQFHGSDAIDGLSFSVRIDGIFTEEFRALMPKPAFNAASTPSLWACTNGAEYA